MLILKKFCQKIHSLLRRFFLLSFCPCLFFLFPIKGNKIVFINFNGKGFGCNPKYIALEILRQELPWDLVWLVNDLKEPMPAGIRVAKFRTPIGLYEIATAKVIVVNVKNSLCLIKKKGQYVIQTWHASYSSKLVEKEAEDKLSANYVQESKYNSKQTDLFLSNSAVMSQCIRDSFWYDGEIMECGYPRNDMLFTADTTTIAQIKAALGVSSATKLVLYAPTFRDDLSTDAYDLDCLAVLEKLRCSGEDWKLLTRLHPNVANTQMIFPESEHIINATPYPDMQELLLASDILITDYSSTPFDFAVMQKQVYIYASDIAQYQKLRGIKPDFFTMPYPVCTSNAELLTLIAQYSPEKAVQQAKEFIAFFGGVDQGNAAAQVVDRIRSIIFTETT